jgi:signal transduction histidine kinase
MDEPQAQRLLAVLRKSLGHDLSNHLVAVFGLLRMLELEDGARLSADGQDYLRRLFGAVQRAQTLVGQLSALVWLDREDELAEEVSLTDLVREVGAVMKQLFPERLIEYHLTIRVPLVTAPRRALRQALAGLLKYVVQSQKTNVRLAVGSELTPAGVVLWVAERVTDRAAGEWSGQAPAALPNEDLGLILVRETAVHWGGALEVRSTPHQGTVYTVLIGPQSITRSP